MPLKYEAFTEEKITIPGKYTIGATVVRLGLLAHLKLNTLQFC